MPKKKCLILSYGHLQVSVLIETDTDLLYTQFYVLHLKDYNVKIANTHSILEESGKFYSYFDSAQSSD